MLRHGLQLTNRGENWHNAARIYSLVWRNERLTSISEIWVFWCNQTAGSWVSHSQPIFKGTARYRFMVHLITMCQTSRPAEFNNKWLNYNNWQVTIYVESCREQFWIQSPARTRKPTYYITWSTADFPSNYCLIAASVRLLSESFINKKKWYFWDHACCLCLRFSLQPAGSISWNSECSTVGGETTP